MCGTVWGTEELDGPGVSFAPNPARDLGRTNGLEPFVNSRFMGHEGPG